MSEAPRRSEGNVDAGRPNGALGTELELIADMSQDFARCLDVDATLRRALARITDHIDAQGGAVFLLDAEGEQLVCHASVGPVQLDGLRLPLSHGIVGRSVRNDSCELVRDVLQDPNFDSAVDADTGFQTRSILCASLSVQDRSLGAIELVNKRGRDRLFDDRDRRLLRTLAASAGLALQNARLAADLMDQERVRRELELAAEIQRSLLPERRPAPFPAAGVNVAARDVSGDFFDYLPLEDGRIAFAVGDVAGKGMNAALLMAKTASLFRCLVKSEPHPGRLLARINEEICDTATRGLFVTMVAGLYDPANHRVCLANAGHEPPLLHHRDGHFDAFEAEVPPLGIAPFLGGDQGLPVVEIDLDGGALYVFTDGVTEGRSDAGEMLGAEGIRALLAKYESLPPGERVEATVRPLAHDPLHDDLTLLVVDDACG